MKKIKWLFQGDSITDAGRNRRDWHHMGNGYPKYAAEALREACPEVEFEFFNQGLGGNRTSELFDRLYKDGIAIEPDVFSILIGINDIWHRYGENRIATTDEQLLLNYRCILERIKRETKAKIVMMTPFILDCDDKQQMRADLARVADGIHALAEEFADVYIRLDEHFAAVLPEQPMPHYYSGDGVHPNQNGSAFIGKIYAEETKCLVE